MLLASPPPSDAVKARLTATETALEGLLTAVAPSMANGDKTLAFQKQWHILSWWIDYTASLTDASFVVKRYVPCSLPGNQTKSVAVTLSRLDLLPMLDGTAPTSADLGNASITVSCSSPFVVAAPGGVRDTERKLAGAREQTWVFARMEIVMGGEGKCRAGETWRFGSGHDVQFKQCDKGKVAVSDGKWSIAEEGSLDTVLTIGPDHYYLTFWEVSGARYMRLRTKVVTKTEARIDREFRLDQD